MKKETFAIETSEGIAHYKGVTFGDLWNGWECPLFDLKTTIKILNDVVGGEEQKHEYDFTFYQYDNVYDVIIETSFYNATIECVQTHKPIVIDNKKYYSIGSYCWTWMKKSNYTF
jgi:hypothetical protein